MKLLDIHAHLNFPDYDADRDQIIAALKEEGVGVINVGTTLATSREVVALAERGDNLWATVGVHPHDALPDFNLEDLELLAQHERVVAVGECGLDYFRLEYEKQKIDQEKLFVAQVELATRVGKPLMLHIREAYDDVLKILHQYPAARAHAHFFAGSVDTAKQYLDRGCSLSFTGVITFTDAYDEVIRYVPMDRLMVETDAPYVAPVPHRGKRNDPRYVRYVAERVANLKNLTPDAVMEASMANARRVFNLGQSEL